MKLSSIPILVGFVGLVFFASAALVDANTGFKLPSKRMHSRAKKGSTVRDDSGGAGDATGTLECQDVRVR